MSKITAELIREVREASGAPILRAKKVLEEVKGDKEKAIEILKKEGFAKMSKRGDRKTGQGIVVSYEHHNGRVASLVELQCETDFVAKNDLFQKTARSIAMQIASMDPKNEKELLAQDFVKDSSKKIEDLINEVATKTGEVIRLGKFTRVSI